MADRSHLIGSVIGHEGSGRIIEVGSKVKTLTVGDFVGIESHRATEQWLKAGKNPYADPLSAILGYRGFPDGRVVQGTFAEFIAVPEMYAIKIPDHLFKVFPPSIWEPFGNSIRISSVVRKIPLVKSEPVVISGCGYQGLTLMLILKHWLGFSNIYATDMNQGRLDIVDKLGAARLSAPDKLPVKEPKIWFEMSGSMAAYAQGLKSVKKGGALILFGLPSKDSELADGISYKEFIFQSKRMVKDGVNLIGVCGRLREDWDEAPKIVEKLSKSVNLSLLYTFFGPLENLLPLIKNGKIPPKDEPLIKAVFSGFLV